MKLHFFGATGRVTGSNYLLETKGKKIVIDCGMFQGSSAERGKNFEPFAFDPRDIDAVLITHSHIDHIGRIPKLLKEGFSGKIHSTIPCKAFAKVFLSDTMKRHSFSIFFGLATTANELSSENSKIHS